MDFIKCASYGEKHACEIVVLSPPLPPDKLLNQLTDFYKIWWEHYAMKRCAVSFPVITNNIGNDEIHELKATKSGS
jgi:hypothetical protein